MSVNCTTVRRYDFSRLGVSGSSVIGAKHTYIDNTGRDIEPKSSDRPENAETLLVGSTDTIVNNDDTNLTVRTRSGEKKCGLKSVGCQGVHVQAKSGTGLVEADGDSEANGFEMQDTENVTVNLSGGSVTVCAKNGGKASYVNGDF